MASEKCKKPKALIVYYSMTGNTEKVAKAIAKGLKKNASVAVKKANEFKPEESAKYDILGFGSGVYAMRFSKEIMAKIEAVPNSSKKFFLFSTSGLGIAAFGKPKSALKAKGLEFIGGFKCRGFENLWPFRLFGGINRGKPSKENLRKAEDFGASV